MKRKKQIALGIGSNLGDRLRHLQKGLALLSPFMEEVQVSTVFETKAELLPGSPPEWDLPFYNCVAIGKVALTPRELLGKLKEIEEQVAPRAAQKWAPRALDLDILAYEEEVIDEEGLSIPHSELLNRPFALQPMAQLLPYWRYPDPHHGAYGKTLLELSHLSPLAFSRSLVVEPQLVGVVNVTPDSFSDGGLFCDPEKATTKALQLWEEGASWVELGALATSPRATLYSFEEEWRRLSPVLQRLSECKVRPRLSIDTYHTQTALRALEEFDVEMINWVGEEINAELIQKIERGGKQLVVMHRLSLPPSRTNVLPYEEDPLEAILKWGREALADLEEKGLDRRRVIVDPGVGFGKTALQNRMILQRIAELKVLGVPLFVGHSRKLFIASFSASRPSERDRESMAISLYLKEQGVDFLRVHDVVGHMTQFVAHHSVVSMQGANAFQPTC